MDVRRGHQIPGEDLAGLSHLIPQQTECLYEPALVEESAGNVVHLLRQKRRRRDVSSYPFRMVEVIEVVTPSTADGEGHGERLAATPRSSHALLVVEPLWGHVRLEHHLEWADVDANLHRRRYRQQVDFSLRLKGRLHAPENAFRIHAAPFSSDLVPPRNEDSLELALPRGGVLCLASQLLAVKAVRPARVKLRSPAGERGTLAGDPRGSPEIAPEPPSLCGLPTAVSPAACCLARPADRLPVREDRGDCPSLFGAVGEVGGGLGEGPRSAQRPQHPGLGPLGEENGGAGSSSGSSASFRMYATEAFLRASQPYEPGHAL